MIAQNTQVTSPVYAAHDKVSGSGSRSASTI
jgi:hypothetical protein